MGRALRYGLMGMASGIAQGVSNAIQENIAAAKSEALRQARMAEQMALQEWADGKRKAEKLEDREYSEKREEALYTRGRTDKLTDEERAIEEQKRREKVQAAEAQRNRETYGGGSQERLVTWRMPDGSLITAPQSQQPAGAVGIEYADGGKLPAGGGKSAAETRPASGTGPATPAASPANANPAAAPPQAPPWAKEGARIQGPDGIYEVRNGVPVKVN